MKLLHRLKVMNMFSFHLSHSFTLELAATEVGTFSVNDTIKSITLYVSHSVFMCVQTDKNPAVTVPDYWRSLNLKKIKFSSLQTDAMEKDARLGLPVIVSQTVNSESFVFTSCFMAVFCISPTKHYSIKTVFTFPD